jgi:hypothetical protein
MLRLQVQGCREWILMWNILNPSTPILSRCNGQGYVDLTVPLVKTGCFTGVGEDAGKKEPSYTVGGNVD